MIEKCSMIAGYRRFGDESAMNSKTCAQEDVVRRRRRR